MQVLSLALALWILNKQLFFYRETDLFFPDSGVHLAQTQRDMLHFRRAAFLAQIKAKVGSTLARLQSYVSVFSQKQVSIT
jgi:hypothetical protein